MIHNPTCPYCEATSAFVGGDTIYPHRPDLHSKVFFHCEPCDAYVGCHPNTEKPLGRLANAELRRAKMDAHKAFDHTWKNGSLSRPQAYAWLAKKLDIPGDDCHIGMFNVKMCKRVVEACADVFLEEFQED